MPCGQHRLKTGEHSLSLLKRPWLAGLLQKCLSGVLFDALSTVGQLHPSMGQPRCPGLPSSPKEVCSCHTAVKAGLLSVDGCNAVSS